VCPSIHFPPSQLSKVSASQSHLALPLDKMRKVGSSWAQGMLALVTGAREGVFKVGFKPASRNMNNSSVLAAGCLCGAVRWVHSARQVLGYRAEMLAESHLSKNWALSCMLDMWHPVHKGMKKVAVLVTWKWH